MAVPVPTLIAYLFQHCNMGQQELQDGKCTTERRGRNIATTKKPQSLGAAKERLVLAHKDLKAGHILLRQHFLVHMVTKKLGSCKDL